MIELLDYRFVQLAILTVLVLAGIHAYMGYHVVSRGVIFVDLSLAQVSALGATVAFCVGIHDSPAAYAISLLFTLAGALVISLSRTRDERVPPEAFIGILYAAAGSFPLLLLSHHAEASEMLHHMIAGSLLTVSPAELLKISVLYAVIGLFFYRYRERFNLISTNRDEAEARGWNLLWWDFLFYAAFAVVVTSSVAVAGVLLVFSLLVIPPVCALLVTPGTRQRLTLGWAIAGAGSLVGVLASVAWDLPAGPTVITALAALLLVTVGARRVARR